MGESCGPAWVKAGSGPLPEHFNVGGRCLPEHTSLSCPTPPHPSPLPEGEREETPADKPVRRLSSQEKKGRSPPPVPRSSRHQQVQKRQRNRRVVIGGCHARRSPLSCPL